MSPFVGAAYAERIHTLALGVELIDAQRGGRVGTPMEVMFDGLPLPVPRARRAKHVVGFQQSTDILERLPRHVTCQHVLLDRPGLKPTHAFRFVDRTRRFVPRLLEVSLAARPVFLRPWFFPGAAYALSERSTGLRGRVVAGADHTPVRWTRVVARRGPTVVGRARGDDRGEFLLLIHSEAGTIGPLVNPLNLDVTIHAPPPPAAPAPADRPSFDPYWDLPLEPTTTEADIRGEVVPAGWASQSRTIPFRLSRLLSLKDNPPAGPLGDFVFP